MDNATSSRRVTSVDLLRGIVMILMALDHTRDYASVLRIRPEDMEHASFGLFMTRWVTHFCAPAFFLLSGIGATLMLRAGRTKGQLSKFLLTRGLWLILLEVTILHFAWNFNWGFPKFLLVIWALGLSMIVLSALIHLPTRVVAVFALLVIVLHNLLDGIRPELFGALAPLWVVLHTPGLLSPRFFVGYPLVPWFAVMALGYALGDVFSWEPPARKRFLTRAGIAATIGFVLLRLSNTYGNPFPWSAQRNALMTVASFLNTNKYPPSLLYLLMTLGPALIALSVFDNARGKLVDVITVYGKVPFFYYVTHIFVIHILSAALAQSQGGQWQFLSLDTGSFPKWYGVSLPGVYLLWAIVVLLLYIPCRWFAELKARKKSAWLSYL